MAIARIFFGLILIFLFVAFSLKNMGPVSVDLYFRKTPELPLFVWLFFAALFGVIVAWVVAISEQLRLRRAFKKEKKEKEELEDKVEKLKKEIELLEERLTKQREILGSLETSSSTPEATPEVTHEAVESPEGNGVQDNTSDGAGDNGTETEQSEKSNT